MSLTTANISCPLKKRSQGCAILDTDMESMGIRETIPQPMSTKHPKGSRCVILAGMTSPRLSVSVYFLLHSSCALRRERIYAVSPPLRVISMILKHTVLFTRESRAISLTDPSSIPIAPSLRGIIPFPNGSSTIRSCFGSHISA